MFKFNTLSKSNTLQYFINFFVTSPIMAATSGPAEPTVAEPAAT